jgi:hypothetical protein
MCNFLSAIVLKNGDVLTHPMLDAHADLVKYFKLPDGNEHIHHFAKVELVPSDWEDAATWQFTVDEPTLPVWWSDIAEQAEATLRARAKKMILREGEHELIVEGCWIVAGTAKIRDVRSGRIVRVSGGTISGVSGGTISNVWGGTISNVSGGTISDVSGGTISDVWGGTISNVRGGSLLDTSAKAHVAKTKVKS